MKKAGLALAAILLAALVGGVVLLRPVFVHATSVGDFDLRAPGCEPSPAPAPRDDELQLRYLGVGGVYLRWRGTELMTAPFFTRYSPWEAQFGTIAPDARAIADGLAEMPLDGLDAILVGHSHFDHLGDVPTIARDHAPDARIAVNASGARMLAAFPDLAARIDVLGEPFAVGDAVRVTPIPSEHGRHHRLLHYAHGTVASDWTTFEGRPLSAMVDGATWSFLVELLDADGAVFFRLLAMDSAASAPHGIPGGRLDLAVLCMPLHWLADGYPETLLERTRPRHRMATHYEDFLQTGPGGLRLVATLTEGRAASFLDRLAAVAPPDAALEPVEPVCGPAGTGWSMPLPGSWLRFPVFPRSD